MLSTSDKTHKWAVVLAGGDGTRLQELTRRISGDSRPKQFCEFFGGKSLLAHTRDRIAPVFHEERTLFVLTQAHEAFYRPELGDVQPERRVVQPENRGTAVAMALCLELIAQQDENALVSFFPSDHDYADCSAFRESVESGLRMIEEYRHCLLIFGAEARYPEIEYGWIEPGPALVDSVVHPLHRVSRFWEKPALEHAAVLRRRGCLWNTFVTIGLARTFLELLSVAVPEVTRSFAVQSVNYQLDGIYANIPRADFSRSVLTKMPERLVVLGDAASGWTDFGSPRRVVDVLSRHGVTPSWLVPNSPKNRLYR